MYACFAFVLDYLLERNGSSSSSLKVFSTIQVAKKLQILGTSPPKAPTRALLMDHTGTLRTIWGLYCAFELTTLYFVYYYILLVRQKWKMNVKLVLAFFLPKARYLFVLLAFCRSLLCLKIAYAYCLRMMRAGSYIIFYTIW